MDKLYFDNFLKDKMNFTDLKFNIESFDTKWIRENGYLNVEIDNKMKHIDFILEELSKDISNQYKITVSYPKELGISDEDISDVNGCDIKHFTFKKKNGNYYSKISFDSFFKADQKECRDTLVKILQEKGVTLEAGSRMKLEVRTRSLLYSFRYLIKNTKIINKFNL